MQKTKTALILLAAGQGNRAGKGYAKPYRSLHSGRSALEQLISFFSQDSRFNPVICAIRAEDQPLFDQIDKPDYFQSVYGGKTRAESSFLALQALKDQSIDRVFIHDAARPFISRALTDRLFEALKEHQAVIPVLPQKEALKKISPEGFVKENLVKSDYVSVQTPQAFDYSALLKTYQSGFDTHTGDDDAEIAFHKGLKVKTIPGEVRNIKLTYREDFLSEEQDSSIEFQTITGIGFDIHRLDVGLGLMLGGVFIDCPYRLIGHSDADVILHALTDAILGALAEGDIGDHFPPTDPQWKDQASEFFVKHALKLVKKHRAELIHIDLNVITETPKIKPYRDQIRNRLSELTGLPLSAISLKATTMEGLDAIGQKQGLACQASINLKKPAPLKKSSKHV